MESNPLPPSFWQSQNLRSCLWSGNIPRRTQQLTVALVVNHLEEISIYRLAKEEPLKWCGTQRLDQLPTRTQNALAQTLKVVQRVK